MYRISVVSRGTAVTAAVVTSDLYICMSFAWWLKDFSDEYLKLSWFEITSSSPWINFCDSSKSGFNKRALAYRNSIRSSGSFFSGVTGNSSCGAAAEASSCYICYKSFCAAFDKISTQSFSIYLSISYKLIVSAIFGGSTSFFVTLRILLPDLLSLILNIRSLAVFPWRDGNIFIIFL